MIAATPLPAQAPGPAAHCSYCGGVGVLEATDLFCGAGGSSLGLEFVRCPLCARQLIKVTQALNHWDLAVQAHNANFPDADHDVHSVHEIQPSRFRRTPLFWASPECVNHTSCKGKRDDSPEAQRSRATFRDIVRFTAYHKYDAVIVENVVEARLWCEHDDCACGAEFDAWYQAMLAEGYTGQIIYFNSQFALPTPQSRDRMYVVFTRVGLRRPDLDFQPMSWCSVCGVVVAGVQTWKKASRGSSRDLHVFEWGRYGMNYVYRCPNEGCGLPVAPAVVGAISIIDQSRAIERIADKPARYCKTCGKRHPVACNTRKRIRVGVQNIGRRTPVAVQVGGNLYERDGYARVWSIDEPMKTVLATSTTAYVVPERSGSVPAPVATPTPAVTGRGQLAMVFRAGGQAPAARELDEPTMGITAHDRQVGLLMQNMTNNVPHSVDEPAPPVTTRGNHVLVQPADIGLVEFRGDWGTVRPAGIPAQTVTAGGTHHGMLLYNGTPGFVRELGDTAGTVTGRDKQSLLVPYYRTGVAKTADEPFGAVTTRDREAFVITDTEIDDYFLRMFHWTELLKVQMMHMLPTGLPYNLTARRRDRRGRLIELSDELCTKMIGNAVSAPVATLIGCAVVDVLIR